MILHNRYTKSFKQIISTKVLEREGDVELRTADRLPRASIQKNTATDLFFIQSQKPSNNDTEVDPDSRPQHKHHYARIKQ